MSHDPHRNTTICRTILEVLDAAEPYPIAEADLRTEINARVRPPAGVEEFGEAMAALQRKRAAATVEGGLDPDLVKWTITETGRAVLAAI
jgi:hypothetical protein